MTRDEMREMLAREIARHNGHHTVSVNKVARKQADAVLAAIESTGHVIVPREPTEEMVEAGTKARWRFDDHEKELTDANTKDTWAAMLASHKEKTNAHS